MAGIGLLLNPRAKHNARDPELPGRLARQLGDDGEVRTATTPEELGCAAEDFKKIGIDMLVIGGGDGTNHVTITGLTEVYGSEPLPALALLRGGTMNTIANSFRIPRLKPESLLNRYLMRYSEQNARPMKFARPNVLRVGNRYGFIFGTGAIHGFIAEYSRRETRSAQWAAQVLARAIGSAMIGGKTIQRVAAPWHGGVRFPDGSAFPEGRYLTVGASTCREMGLGFKPFHRNGERAGYFHVLGIHASPSSFIMGMPRMWQGKSLGGHRSYDALVNQAVLEPSGEKVAYTLDGDLYEHDGPLSLSCGPQLKLIVP